LNFHRPVSVSIKQPLRLKSLAFFALSIPVLFSQTKIPEWCRALPRPEYKVLQRVPISDRWFEVYKVAPAVFAIYEPHQSEEVISYLIVGDKRAALFDTGMGISDLKKVTSELTRLPIVVLNSHTHNDHVGDNWQFDTIYAMDTDFTRENARGSREDAQAEVGPGQICGKLPKGFDPKTYSTPGLGRSRHTRMTVTESISPVDRWKSSPPRVTRQTPSLSSTAPAVCSLRATHTIPLPSGYTVPKPIWKPMLPRSADLQPLSRK